MLNKKYYKNIGTIPKVKKPRATFTPLTPKKIMDTTSILKEQSYALQSRQTKIANRQLSATAQKYSKKNKQPRDQVVSKPASVTSNNEKSHKVMPTSRPKWSSKSGA